MLSVAARSIRLAALLALAAASASAASSPDGSDPRAVALAESVLERMGGKEAWEQTRFLRWKFFGRRLHHWDRWTGDVRIESDGQVVLMNIVTKEGRVWDGETEVADPEERAAALETGYAWWVNDSYWLLMPYKLLDPGVTLRWVGEDELEDGRAADRIVLTFEEVGLTPENKYDVWVARDTGLVEQWAYYPSADQAEPSFTLPWAGWKRFGGILLATERGRGADWEIAAPDSLPRSLFESR
jgi:hypothetical protein